MLTKWTTFTEKNKRVPAPEIANFLNTCSYKYSTKLDHKNYIISICSSLVLANQILCLDPKNTIQRQ